MLKTCSPHEVGDHHFHKFLLCIFVFGMFSDKTNHGSKRVAKDNPPLSPLVFLLSTMLLLPLCFIVPLHSAQPHRPFRQSMVRILK